MILFLYTWVLPDDDLQIVDNVVREGDVSDPKRTGPRVEGVRNLLKALKEDREIEATTISTVGDKGYDGFLYAFVL